MNLDERFIENSETYKKVLRHRNWCPLWGKSMCLDCFGGGLRNFVKDLISEYDELKRDERK